MSGPAPKPTALRLIEGNKGKRGINKQEPDPEYLSDLTAPAWLPASAAAVWGEIVPHLQRAKMLTTIDVEALSQGCVAMANYREATRLTGGQLLARQKNDKGEPVGIPFMHPALIVQSMSFKQAMGVFAQFGMTPAARSRVAINPQENLFNDITAGAGYFTR